MGPVKKGHAIEEGNAPIKLERDVIEQLKHGEVVELSLLLGDRLLAYTSSFDLPGYLKIVLGYVPIHVDHDLLREGLPYYLLCDLRYPSLHGYPL